MLKKIIVIASFIVLLGVSFILLQKTKQSKQAPQQEGIIEAAVEETLPETIYNFNHQSLPEDCSEQEAIYCAVENAVKCTINPDNDKCKSLNLPTFIFLKDPSVERPSEINYRYTDKKVLPNGTVELYTESSCNARWFGLCQGNVIYVLDETEDNWYIKDIYSIE